MKTDIIEVVTGQDEEAPSKDTEGGKLYVNEEPDKGYLNRKRR